MNKIGLGLKGLVIGLLFPVSMAIADDGVLPGQLPELTARWWQWNLSIPTDRNPQLDTTGEDCMVGQRGSIWFLADLLFGGSVTRTCSVPEGKTLFFPVIHFVSINTPNVCGQGPDNLTVKEMRATNKAFIDAVTNVSVRVDGKDLKKTILGRVQSVVFEIALPEDNEFDEPCVGLGNVPAGIYSPAVDDGLYVTLPPMPPGGHTIHFHAEGPGQVPTDVRYDLTVVPVLLK